MAVSSDRQRLDAALVARGLTPTRARARDAIKRGTVTVNGVAERRPATPVDADAVIAVDDPAGRYVARSALKLIAALDHFGYSASGLTVLDVGASTGGFTEVLLERGAAHVHAVDVGHGQLHRRLAANRRVTNHEGLNARDLTAATVGGGVDALVADVSFVALGKVLGPGLALVRPGGWAVLLVKPQFEVGRAALGKGGVVRDPAVAEAAATAVAAWLDDQPGWQVEGVIEAPIRGGDGNREFLLGAKV